ncbi:hypothetical protein Tco_0020215 [Tanacetum coccineum]
MVPISVMKRKIGDGMSTLFRHDVWINDTPLAQQFPRLFLLEEFKNAMVGDRWNGSSFAWNWRRPLRGGTEDDQYHRICDIIKQCQAYQDAQDHLFLCFFLMCLSPGAYMGPHLKHRGVKTGGMASVGEDFSLA